MKHYILLYHTSWYYILLYHTSWYYNRALHFTISYSWYYNKALHFTLSYSWYYNKALHFPYYVHHGTTNNESMHLLPKRHYISLTMCIKGLPIMKVCIYYLYDTTFPLLCASRDYQ